MKEKHRITILSENIPMVLYRIAGIFARRKINIESLVFAEAENGEAQFTVTVKIGRATAEQVSHHIRRIIEVREVSFNEI
ncbi:MAG: hypothetical protein C4584_00850 [Armatimonadetes bacterium]|nr:MAG: hypothetical protein C4584_00850 [Armatimonadota bacterium]